jgi:BCD family chlorophyll transporter-like MFS transporter
MIGLGVSAAGTSLLSLMAKRVPEAMRAPAATTVWVMMIVGFAVTAVTVGKLIEPYSAQRLIDVTAGLGVLIVALTTLALWGLESGTQAVEHKTGESMRSMRDFRAALAVVWQDPQARIFTLFVFLSMLAYSSQDLVLEPFAGAIFGMTPGETTQLSGTHHSGVLIGMLAVALAGSRRVAGRLGSVQAWMIGGCWVSALAMAGLASAGLQGGAWPLKANVVLLGMANGAFSIAAIATMMRLANAGDGDSQGTRMGLWGAAQALAFGLGGVLGTALSDLAHSLLGQSGWAYASVFTMESGLFVVSALCAVHMGRITQGGTRTEHTTHPVLGQKGLS